MRRFQCYIPLVIQPLNLKKQSLMIGLFEGEYVQESVIHCSRCMAWSFIVQVKTVHTKEQFLNFLIFTHLSIILFVSLNPELDINVFVP